MISFTSYPGRLLAGLAKRSKAVEPLRGGWAKLGISMGVVVDWKQGHGGDPCELGSRSAASAAHATRMSGPAAGAEDGSDLDFPAQGRRATPARQMSEDSSEQPASAGTAEGTPIGTISSARSPSEAPESGPSAAAESRAARAHETPRYARSVAAWFAGWDKDELLICASLVALCALVRVLWLTTVDIYGDAGNMWHFARQLAFDNDFSHAKWTHQMARFGVTLPAHLIQRAFGTSGTPYYILPVTMYTLQALFVYLTTRRLGGRLAGLLAALILIFWPGTIRSSSQLLPDGMGGTMAIAAGYAFLRFHEGRERERLYWLLALTGACIGAYAIKESNVLLFPGVALAVLLSRRSWKEALVFCSVLAAYGLLETAFFQIFTDYAHRLAVVNEEHGFYDPIHFTDLFDRFTQMHREWKPMCWAWFVTVAVQLASSDRRRRLLLLFPVSFLFFLTFLVRSIDPLIQWMAFKPRYLEPAAPFWIMGIGLVTGEALAEAWRRLLRPSWRDWMQAKVPRAAGLYVLIACVLIGSAMYAGERSRLKRHTLVQSRNDAAVANDAFERNLPLVEKATTPRGLKTVYSVYLDPQLLAQSEAAPHGVLPDINDGVRSRRKGYDYILRNPSRYRRGELERLVEEGCAVKVSTPHSRLRVSPAHKLPSRCKAPR